MDALESEKEDLKEKLAEAQKSKKEDVEELERKLQLAATVGKNVKALFDAKEVTDRSNAELREENEKLKIEVSRLEKQLVDKEAACSKAATTVAESLAEFTSIKEEHTAELAAAGSRVAGLEAELLVAKKDAESLRQRFVDPVSNEKHKCPLMQTNGTIRSMSGIIEAWLGDPNVGQSNVFRYFQCPVLKSFTAIAPFPIVDSFIGLAESVGLDITPPLTFQFKDSGGSWAEFPFHEQMELIVRLCDVYLRRRGSNNPPEQRNVSAGGLSFMINMRSVMVEGACRLECFGSGNGGRVDIRLTLDPEWTHPFTDMDLSSVLG